MGLIRKISDAVKGRTQVAEQETQGQIFRNPLCSNAENVFAQTRPLVDAMKMVQPYGVGRNGARLASTRTPELMALKMPNSEMGEAEFADLMFTTWLTEKELNLHAWKNQRGKIYGYTVLPPDSRFVMGGEVRFRTTRADGSIEELTRDEVMTLRFSRNPRSIDSGISPGIASMVWSQVDDVLAQYQLAHFENGAVPAYVTIIRASTREKYLEKRRELEQGFHGAKNKGKTLFLWRQFLDNGDERDEVEVKTIQGSNASLAIKEIMAIVNDKLNKAFGVSNFILGDDASAKYDNAELSQQQFLSHRVYPALYTFWSQFQHELDRLTGGIGYAIQFDLDIPELTDRLKVKAETKKIEAETANLHTTKDKIEQETAKLRSEAAKVDGETLITLVQAGGNPAAVVAALGLDNKWLEVAQSISNGVAGGVPETPSLSEQLPDSAPHDHVCSCHHHTHDATTPQFTKDEVVEETIYEELVRILQSVINEALGEGTTLGEEEIDQIREAILAQLLEEADRGANDAAKSVQGIVLGAIGKEIAGVLKNGGFHMTEDFAERLQKRTETLVNRFQGHAKEVVAETLNPLREKALSASEIKQALQEVMPRARAETIARNETTYAFRAGHLENDKYIAQKYHLRLKKIWRCHPGACDICKAMDGKEVEIDEAFPDSVEDADGIRYSWEHDSWNDGGQITSAHVNCRCYPETIVEGYND